jgi:hypothetical protein
MKKNKKSKENTKTKNETINKYGKVNENGKRTRENLKETKTENETLYSKKFKKVEDEGDNNISSKINNPAKGETFTRLRKNTDTNNNIPLIKEKPICTICLDEIKHKALIEKCNHEFCYDCLNKWSDKSSSCPLCKKDYDKFAYWTRTKVYKYIKSKEFDDYDYDDETWVHNSSDNCMVCHSGINAHLLLVCDECDYNVCHTYCLQLDRIPDGDWICKECKLNKVLDGINSADNNENKNICIKDLLSESSDNNSSDDSSSSESSSFTYSGSESSISSSSNSSTPIKKTKKKLN